MLIEAVLLFGVKTTSKRLAVKREFSWHASSELDRRTCSALAGRMKAASDERRKSGFIVAKRILTGAPSSHRGPGRW
jgi:hypothetical protein